MSGLERFAIRLGVTGTRNLPLDVQSAASLHISSVLATVAAACDRYQNNTLRLISPLAEGADRLVARLAVTAGYSLEVICPFRVTDYESDFGTPATPNVSAADCLQEFRSLLAQAATVLELDGCRQTEAASYEAVGRAVARNADLMIAVWNGKPGAGRGGTAETVRFALSLGVPVWWVPTDGRPPVWLTEASELPAIATRASQVPSGGGEAAMRSLDAHLASIRRRPAFPRHHVEQGHAPGSHPHGLLERLFGGFLPASDPATAVEQVRLRGWFSVYGWFERLLAYDRADHPSAVMRPGNGQAETWPYWNQLYTKYDAFASINMSAYRSTYVIVFFLAAIALVFAVCALAFPTKKIFFTAIEFVVLIILAFMVFISQKNGWHDRAVRFRLTAELIRKQSFLSLLAETVPLPRPHRMGDATDFANYLRSAPLASGQFSPDILHRVAGLVARELLSDQESYHARRARKMKLVGKRLALVGDALFIATILLVSIKLALLLFGVAYGVTVVIGVLSAIFPAVAAFSVGVRSYAEFELMAAQSVEMAAYMLEAKERWRRIDFDASNASQEMGSLLRDIATQMLVDVQGWSAVARSKPVEAG